MDSKASVAGEGSRVDKKKMPLKRAVEFDRLIDIRITPAEAIEDLHKRITPKTYATEI